MPSVYIFLSSNLQHQVQVDSAPLLPPLEMEHQEQSNVDTDRFYIYLGQTYVETPFMSQREKANCFHQRWAAVSER